jgi:predicted PurR-regulated permease PerM
MNPSRKEVLVGVFAALGVLTALILLDVLATVFFAMTVAYVCSPVYGWLRNRGVPKWWASAATTMFAFGGALSVFAPIFVIVYLRRTELAGLIDRLPEELTLEAYGYGTTITFEEIRAMGQATLEDLAVQAAGALPTLLIKLGLFALVLFALFLAQARVKRTVLALAPEPYHDVVASFVVRTKETLYAIYVLQAITGLGTFLIGIPVFWVLGYDAIFGLALIGGILQFVPIIGPSVLIVVLAAFEVTVGNVTAALEVLAVAGLFIAILPDLVIRPRFARRTANMPGSLYFIGFTGGVFSLGPVGIIAGPLIVSLFSESVQLLSGEMQNSVDSQLAEHLGFDPGEGMGTPAVATDADAGGPEAVDGGVSTGDGEASGGADEGVNGDAAGDTSDRDE